MRFNSIIYCQLHVRLALFCVRLMVRLKFSQRIPYSVHDLPNLRKQNNLGVFWVLTKFSRILTINPACCIILICIQQDATLRSLFYLKTALHVSGGTTHYQERKQLYLQQTGSNSSTIATDSSNGVTNTRCCRYSCMRS